MPRESFLDIVTKKVLSPRDFLFWANDFFLTVRKKNLDARKKSYGKKKESDLTLYQDFFCHQKSLMWEYKPFKKS